MVDSGNYFRGETLVLLLDFLDENALDEVIQRDIDTAVVETSIEE